MKKNCLIILLVFMLSACSEKKTQNSNDLIIGSGQMPNLVKDSEDHLHLVYGSGDSIMYSYSSDQGISFFPATLITILPKLAASHTRGPQIASGNNGLTVIACNSSGDIYSFYKNGNDKWLLAGKVNDVDTIAKENLIALSANNKNAFAVWLDIRDNGQNKIFGAKSEDGGKSWKKNIMIYTSPDTTVCECCKPSVQMNGNNVYVMFRNWLNGNRDMYLIESTDGGNTFGQAQKLGNGTWKLDGCPMDGGSFTVDKMGALQTVWRREGKVFSSVPGSPEKEIGAGKGCVVEAVNGKNIYAWTENGDVVVITSPGQKKLIGRGSQPVIKALSNDKVICVWENEKQIHSSVIEL